MIFSFIRRAARQPVAACIAWLWLWASPVFSGEQPLAAAIASAHPEATRAGLQILQQGGNAFDAAVTVSAVLAVVEPYSSGFGGGGFWLLHRAEDGKQLMIDGRETAPAAAHRDLYLDADGNPQKQKSINGPLAAGIPGMPAALVHLSEHYGRLPLSQTLQPAIDLAESGFVVESHYQRMAGFRLKALQGSPDAAAIFLDQGDVPQVGFRIRQPDLARTIRHLADQGHAGFYQGPVAQRMVDAVRQSGGIWTAADLLHYQVKEREPITGQYRGIRIVSAPPPSSGGVVMTQALNYLSGFDLTALSDTETMHRVVEAMRWAYRDRALYLGDADFVQMPLARLTSPAYAEAARGAFRADQASDICDAPPVKTSEGNDTTHFSILDSEGNRVAATLSINYPFGSGFVAQGTGVLLNDEMDDFSMSPGVANVYGLVGREANAIEPGKRMLSSMTPTFLETDDRIAILGTPGGSRIISMVMLGVLEFAQGKPPQAWVSRPRYHHQCAPNWIQYEPDTLSSAQMDALQNKGYQLKSTGRRYGNMQAVMWNRHQNRVEAASDPRGLGVALTQ